MRETLPIIYMKCAFCTAKTRCEACGRELDAALMKNSAIRSAVVNVPEKTARLEHELDPDALEELLEDAGLFLGRSCQRQRYSYFFPENGKNFRVFSLDEIV